MLKQSTLDDIARRWEKISPQELHGLLINPDAPDVVQLDARTSTEKGYAGPRERLPIPERFRGFRPTEYFGIDPEKFVEETHKRGLKKIVVVYPTSHRHLSGTPEWGDVHEEEINRLGVSKYIRSLQNEAAKHHMAIEYLPMVKLTHGLAWTHETAMTPIRFWTSSKPPQDAAYLITDDIAQHGTTIASMLSHLTRHGISDTHLVRGSLSTPLGLQDRQMKFISDLHERFPEVAGRADVVLNLIGISGIEAMTFREARSLGIDSDTICSPDSAKNFDGMIRFTLKEIQRYADIPEPTANYVSRSRNLLKETTPTR